jgi:predicted heme/steroid binding protein
MSQVRYRRSNNEQPDSVTQGTTDSLPKSNSESNGLSLLDILRILAALLLLNFTLSYYITKTPLWGNQTKLTNIKYLQFHASRLLSQQGYISLTDEDLSKYNGVDKSLPIYVAVNGSIYDVSSNPLTYGPGGPYSFFSGRDAARAFVTGCFQTDLTYDLRGLDEVKAKADIAGWQRFFDNNSKYWYVGQVSHPPLSGDPPPPCNAMQAPGNVRG